MNEVVTIMKLIFSYYYDFISSPANSDEEIGAYGRLEAMRRLLRETVGSKKALIYSEHMEYLASCQQWETNRDKYGMYLSMRSKSTFEKSL